MLFNFFFKSYIVSKLCTFPHCSNFKIFNSIFYHISWRLWKFKFWWFDRKELGQIYQSQPYFKIKNIFSCIEFNFQVKQWKISNFFFAVFLKLFLKFMDFVNFDDCICEIISKSIRIYPVFILKKLRRWRIDFFLWKNEKFK